MSSVWYNICSGIILLLQSLTSSESKKQSEIKLNVASDQPQTGVTYISLFFGVLIGFGSCCGFGNDYFGLGQFYNRFLHFSQATFWKLLGIRETTKQPHSAAFHFFPTCDSISTLTQHISLGSVVYSILQTLLGLMPGI